MKKLIIIYSFIFISLIGCSNLTQNLIRKGEFTIYRGVFEDKFWNTKLRFYRLSWYRELSLFFELLIVNIPKGSPFNNWFSESEKDTVKNCTTFFVTIAYSMDHKKISQRMFINEMEANDLEEVAIVTFAKNLELHPDFDKSALGQYRIRGFCSKTKEINKIYINFPGFNKTNVL